MHSSKLHHFPWMVSDLEQLFFKNVCTGQFVHLYITNKHPRYVAINVLMVSGKRIFQLCQMQLPVDSNISSISNIEININHQSRSNDSCIMMLPITSTQVFCRPNFLCIQHITICISHQNHTVSNVELLSQEHFHVFQH